MARTDGKTEKSEVVEVNDRIDEEQLDDYREMIEQLGTFPVS
jgi:hypothetical protein